MNENTTTTDSKPNPLAGLIPEELCARIRAHDLAAGRWIQPFLDWCDKTKPLQTEFRHAVEATGFQDNDGIYDELSLISGYERVSLLIAFLGNEVDRLERRNPPERDAIALALVESLTR